MPDSAPLVAPCLRPQRSVLPARRSTTARVKSTSLRRSVRATAGSCCGTAATAAARRRMAAAPRGHPVPPAGRKVREVRGGGVETCSPLGAVLGPDRPGDPEGAACGRGPDGPRRRGPRHPPREQARGESRHPGRRSAPVVLECVRGPLPGAIATVAEHLSGVGPTGAALPRWRSRAAAGNVIDADTSLTPRGRSARLTKGCSR
jgi:hypothetical protein